MTPSRPATGETGSPESQLDLEKFIPYRISVLSNRISGNIARLYGDRYGLAITEWRVMAILARTPGLSASEVSDHTAMDKVAVSRAVARLLERGFIQREIHGDDRRRSVLELLPAGFAVYEVVVPMVLESERRLLGALTEEERTALDRLITRLETAGLQAQAELR